MWCRFAAECSRMFCEYTVRIASVWLRIHVEAVADVPGYRRIEGTRREPSEKQPAAQAADE